MTRKLLLFLMIFTGLLVYFRCPVTFAEGKKFAKPVAVAGVQKQRVFGAVGKIEYVDFKPRGESVIVVKDRDGMSVKISLKPLKDGTTILTTYRKVKDKKDKERNVLISLSIIRPAKELGTSDKKGSK